LKQELDVTAVQGHYAKTANPRQQGLKPPVHSQDHRSPFAKTANPRQQGLKLLLPVRDHGAGHAPKRLIQDNKD